MRLKKILLTTLTASVVSLTLLTLAQSQQKQLFIYIFPNYFAEDTIDNFVAKTSINTQVDYFDTHEMLEAKLITGGSGYDVGFASSPVASRLIPANALQKLDKSKLTNYANLDPFYLEMIQAFDPNNDYMVPYMITTVGIAYNTQALAQRMPDAPVDSLDMFFKPEITEKFSDCGIGVLDSPNEVIPITLNYLGLDPYSTDPQDLDKAAQELAKLRPFVRHMNTSQLIDDMAAGELCLAFMWNGDAKIGARQAEEAGMDFEVIYRLPKEGTSISLDNMVIPVDAKDVDEAHEFINYILEPKVAADITNFVYFPNVNASATEFVSDDMRTNPNFYPPEELRQKMFPDRVLGPDEARERTRIWTEFRSGR